MVRFALTGVAGYVVDTTVLYAGLASGLGFFSGRLLSFLCAVVVTWLLNRRYTFAGELASNSASLASLWTEFCRYLAAMSLGGLLNLATYWIIISAVASHPITPVFAVAAGSLVGMIANFTSAKWWVYKKRKTSTPPKFQLPELTTPICLALTQVVFWCGHLHDMALPGLYMDAVNPDYLAARTLNPALHNHLFLIPTALFPILGNLYHGVQNYYVGIPIFSLLGFNMLALRISQGLFGAGILVLLHFVLKRATGSMWLALVGSLALATEVAFLASFRTQMYIVIAGCFWLLWAIYLALTPYATDHPNDVPVDEKTSSEVGIFITGNAAKKHLLMSGVCAGLAVYSYFVFLFFVPVFLVLGLIHTRSWRAVGFWWLGFMLGMQTYVLGYLSLIIKEGGLAPAAEWFKISLQSLSPMSSHFGFIQSLKNSFLLAQLALNNTGNELMIFGLTSTNNWVAWKTGLFTISLVVLIISIFINVCKPKSQHAENKYGLLSYRDVAWFPISFAAVSLIFGNRLWVHHFSTLVPVMYLILILAINHIQTFKTISFPRWVWGAVAICFIFGNLQQQRNFFQRLEATGGVGKFSNAINRMAEDALSSPKEFVHVFPEWGFIMPFAFLTANQRVYDIDMSSAHLQRLANEGKVLRLYYWNSQDGESYREKLITEGFTVTNSGTYMQRDQKVAFLWIEAIGEKGLKSK